LSTIPATEVMVLFLAKHSIHSPIHSRKPG